MSHHEAHLQRGASYFAFQARRAFDAGDLPTAIACYSSLIDVYNGNASEGAPEHEEKLAKWLTNRSMLRGRAGDLQGSLADAEAALRLDPDRLKAHYRYAKLRLRAAMGERYPLQPANGGLTCVALRRRASALLALGREAEAREAVAEAESRGLDTSGIASALASIGRRGFREGRITGELPSTRECSTSQATESHETGTARFSRPAAGLTPGCSPPLGWAMGAWTERGPGRWRAGRVDFAAILRERVPDDACRPVRGVGAGLGKQPAAGGDGHVDFTPAAVRGMEGSEMSKHLAILGLSVESLQHLEGAQRQAMVSSRGVAVATALLGCKRCRIPHNPCRCGAPS